MDSDNSPAAVEGDELYGDATHISLLKIPIAKDGGAADGEKNSKDYSCSADDGGKDGRDSRWGSRKTASLPGTPENHRSLRIQWEASRDCASETESRSGCCRRRRRCVRERKLDRAWQRRSRAAVSDAYIRDCSGREICECMVVVRPREGCGTMICMDMEEVRACRDLGLEIPRDFTVEIPGGLSGNNSGVDSPNSGAGEDAKEIKAKLKLWAHAVALVSAAARSGR